MGLLLKRSDQRKDLPQSDLKKKLEKAHTGIIVDLSVCL